VRQFSDASKGDVIKVGERWASSGTPRDGSDAESRLIPMRGVLHFSSAKLAANNFLAPNRDRGAACTLCSALVSVSVLIIRNGADGSPLHSVYL
jgi:hypothetical protein